MVGTNLKAETMKLMDERTNTETEMDVIIQRLCQPSGPGLSGNLVDSEGFPRTDIDIPTVRADRRRLAELRNDHKIITEKIDQNIQVLHSARLASTPSVKDSGVQGSAVNIGSSSSPGNYSVTAATSATMDIDVVFSRPFAVIDEITEASPAAEDGLQLGDQVVRFGNVQSGENLLQRLAAEAQSNQGCAVTITVLRQGAMTNVQVTPRVWQGRGLLGSKGNPCTSCKSSSTPSRKKQFTSKSKSVVSDSASDSSLEGLQTKRTCAWVTTSTDRSYAIFHDEEWGVPVHDDKYLYSYFTVRMGRGKGNLTGWIARVSRGQILFEMDGHVHHYQSLEVIENARQVSKITDEFGSFDKYIWSFVNQQPIVGRFRYPHQVPVKTSKSEVISKDLVRRGFRGVGPTVVYSFMQVAGILSSASDFRSV
ncbi:hypothetical protein KY284_029605 [Solanum tuberosum]|nr:hypothetical protein KY284_029605 [Solanum tuberosum]